MLRAAGLRQFTVLLASLHQLRLQPNRSVLSGHRVPLLHKAADTAAMTFLTMSFGVNPAILLGHRGIALSSRPALAPSFQKAATSQWLFQELVSVGVASV